MPHSLATVSNSTTIMSSQHTSSHSVSSDSISPQQTDFINDAVTLAAACEGWQHKAVLAMDTEFIRVDTFYPIPALLQIYDGENCSLVDVTHIQDLSPLIKLIDNPSIVKVFHACGEDLEVFEQLFGVLPSPLFDTQIAAALLGYGFSVGYSRLVKTLLDKDLPLDESRSDWLQRPLTARQQEYAGLDVIFLFQLYEKLNQELSNTDNKQSWFQENCQEQLNLYYSNQNPENYFLRFKNAWRLNPQQQQNLYQLSLWREEKARQKNRPRGRIIKDKSLYGIALNSPTQLSQFDNIEELHPRAIQRYGNELIKVIASCTINTQKNAQPNKGIPQPLPKSMNSLNKQLKQHTQLQAEEWDIAPEILCRKKIYEEFMRSGVDNGCFILPKELCGWRETLVGNVFLTLAQQWHDQK